MSYVGIAWRATYNPPMFRRYVSSTEDSVVLLRNERYVTSVKNLDIH